MPTPELEKDQYSPEEVHSLIKENLGDDAAMQFRMFYSKVSKVPSHEIKVKQMKFDEGGTFRYEFVGGEYADKWDIPKEILEYVNIISPDVHARTADTLGWIMLKFKDIESPEGNTLKIAIVDEIQSDFAQRIGRIRQHLAGTLKDQLKSHEGPVMETIKNNPDLVQKIETEEGVTYKPTKKLMNVINKIESTTYSDIMNYMFNKMLGFAKQKDAVQVWIPDSKLLMEDWKSNARGDPVELEKMFKRFYDDQSVSYGAIQQLEDQPGFKELEGKHWVVNLADVPEARLAKKKIVLSAYWEEGNINSNNWKQIFDIFYRTFMQTFEKEYEEKMEFEGGGGLGLSEESPEAKMSLLVSAFIEETLPAAAKGDEEFVADFKDYLKSKYDYTLDPELESNLYHSTGGGWREVTTTPEKPEGDPSAPSAEELGEMFTMEEPREKDPTAPSAKELEELFRFSRKDKYRGYN